jgi:hypothetical protein
MQTEGTQSSMEKAALADTPLQAQPASTMRADTIKAIPQPEQGLSLAGLRCAVVLGPLEVTMRLESAALLE